ncbi:MAG: tagaturonate reductase [Verrucomicrobia bacterium]|nr:tagaturonate reductase [Verrucomicrobiota bacterium]
MKRLSKQLLQQGFVLPSNLTCGVLADFPERIVQFGEGNFLRAFADWMVDVLNEQGLFGGKVVVVQPIRHGMAATLNEQDGLYTVLLRGVQNGAVVETRRIVTAVSRVRNPYDAWEEVAGCFCNPALRFVVSNTTEAGITFVSEPHRPGQCPESFPAKVTALLFERFQAVKGDAAQGLIFLPCELIEHNGDALRRCVLQHTEAWGLSREFTDWVKNSNHFLNTLVDRIVPGYPHDEAEQLARELGYEDKLLDAGEVFHLWVIEGPRHLAEGIPFHRAGLDVIWTNDLAPYRTRKVRILNGAHTASVLAAFHAGLNTVREMVEDPVFGAFVRRVIFDEILSTVPLPEPEKVAYAEAVLERFRNPFIQHDLLSIALNSVSKWTVRVLPSLLDYLRAKDSLPPLLSFSLAALLYFYRGQRTGTDESTGLRGGRAYPIHDEPAVLDFLAECWTEFESHRDLRRLTTNVLTNKRLWGMDLDRVAGLAGIVTNALEQIRKAGMPRAAAKLLHRAPE